jgi:hypothetical protein
MQGAVFQTPIMAASGSPPSGLSAEQATRPLDAARLVAARALHATKLLRESSGVADVLLWFMVTPLAGSGRRLFGMRGGDGRAVMYFSTGDACADTYHVVGATV